MKSEMLEKGQYKQLKTVFYKIKWITLWIICLMLKRFGILNWKKKIAHLFVLVNQQISPVSTTL